MQEINDTTNTTAMTWDPSPILVLGGVILFEPQSRMQVNNEPATTNANDVPAVYYECRTGGILLMICPLATAVPAKCVFIVPVTLH